MKWKHLSPKFIEVNSTVMKNGCWDWQRYRQSSGYGQVYVEGGRMLAHRLSWIAYKGGIPEGICVLHKCDRRACVNPEHLFLGTYRDNSEDCVAKGRAAFQQPGFDFKFTRKKRVRKLTDDEVRRIRKSKLPLAMLSAMFDVSKANISMIRRGVRKQLVE